MPANPHDLADIAEMPAAGELPSIDPESDSALDELLRQNTEDDGSEISPKKEVETPAATPKKEDEISPPKKEDEKAPPESFAKKLIDDTPPAVPPKKEEKVDEKPVAPPPVKDELDTVALPPYTKPKTGEAFAEVKKLAREKIATTEKEKADLKLRIEELEKKANAGLPKEVEQELAELRKFRGQIDVQADPEFAKYDVQVSENIESIYGKLKTAGFTEDTLQKIKDLGGPGDVDWEALSEKIPPSLKRFVDSKLVENETLIDKKNRAVKTAQEHADEYIKSKANEESDRIKARFEQSNQHLQGFLPKVPWLAEIKSAPDATPEQKADNERHNKLVQEVNGGIQMILEDETPAMRAILAVNYAQHLKLKADHAILKTKSEAELKDLSAKLAEANDLLERVKKNSTNRLRNTPASERSEGGDKAAVDKINEDPGSALDAIAKEVMGR